MTAPANKEQLAPGTVMALFAMALGVFVIANDFTALNVALPAIERDFDVDIATAQWVINAYALFFGLAIVTGGRLADMFGRRKIFFIGSAFFAGFSLLGALSPDVGVLIGTRVGHGDRRRADVAGDPRHDLLGPAAVAGGARRRPDPRRRRDRQRGRPAARRRPDRADQLAWIFVLNVPIAAFAVFVPGARSTRSRSSATSGSTTPGWRPSPLGLSCSCSALDQARRLGLGRPADHRDARRLGRAGRRLRVDRARAPGERALIPPDVIANKRFRAACLTVLLLSAVFFSRCSTCRSSSRRSSATRRRGRAWGCCRCWRVRAHLVHRRPALQPGRDEGRGRVGTGMIALGPILLAVLIGPDAGYTDARSRGCSGSGSAAASSTRR